MPGKERLAERHFFFFFPLLLNITIIFSSYLRIYFIVLKADFLFFLPLLSSPQLCHTQAAAAAKTEEGASCFLFQAGK